MENNKKEHWEGVYETKNPDQVSWTQERPETALALIQSFGLHKSANIIDIGGGDSNLVDFLLADGYENITVLDISGKALEKAQKRLGAEASKVIWIESDILEFDPKTEYDVWHDRATFHFLTTEEQVATYKSIVKKVVKEYLVIGTFSENGPTKCSGLNKKQYGEATMNAEFGQDFNRLECHTEDHITPFDTIQNFQYCSFKRKQVAQ